MKRAWQIVEIGFVGLLVALLTLATFLVWHVIAQRIGSTKDLWDIATAIGTVGAVIVAVVLAVSQERSRVREEFVRAGMLAARLLPKLKIAEVECRDLSAELSVFHQFRAPSVDRLDSFLRDLEKIELSVSTSDLTALAPLPNRGGARLANALEYMDLLRASITANRADVRRGPFDPDASSDWAEWAGLAAMCLKIAMRECEEASDPLLSFSMEEILNELREMIPSEDAEKPH